MLPRWFWRPFGHPEVSQHGSSSVIGTHEATLPSSLSPNWVSLPQLHPHQTVYGPEQLRIGGPSEDRVRAVGGYGGQEIDFEA